MAEEKPETEAPPGEGAEAVPKKKGPLAFLDALPPKLKLPILIGVPVLLILLIVLGLFLGGVFGHKKPVKKPCNPDGEQTTADQPAATESDKPPSSKDDKKDDKDKKDAAAKDDKSGDQAAASADCTDDQTEVSEDADSANKDKKDVKPSYYNMPDILVNLDTHSRKSTVLKVSVTVEVGSPEDVKAMEDKLPRVVDEFQTFLREVRVEDLRGSAGIYRLRQELLIRIKPAVAPIKVKDVLFKELLLQQG